MIDKILERLESRLDSLKVAFAMTDKEDVKHDALERISEIEWFKEIVQEVAKEYGNGWISCSERLPEHMQQCLTTARIYFIPDHVDEPNNYIDVVLNTYSKNFGWLGNPNVIAWQPLPQAYQKGE